MSRNAAIEHWFASMSKSELIDQCFFWHDTALEHGRMYNAVNDENTKLRELVRDTYAFLAWADGATHYGGEPAVHTSDRKEVEQRMRELGIEVPA